jgi:hypothetical protein
LVEIPSRIITAGKNDMTANMRPFYFMIPFWGPTYREYFVDLCLPSLLAPGNFPLLRAGDGHRILIATTKDDWTAIEHLPIIETMRRHVSPVILEIDPPVLTRPGSFDAIMQQNYCQKLLVEAAYDARAYACMLWPDTLLSDGLVAALQRWISEGYELVLFASLRHTQEEVLAELRARGILSVDTKHSTTSRALTITPRVLTDISVRHLHPEVSVYEISDSRLPIYPAFFFSKVPGDRGIIIHTFNGQPILMNFAAIERHDVECLNHGIFEHVYVDRNFSSCKVHFVRDSDEFGVLSLTPAAVGVLPDPMIARRGRLRERLALLCRLRAAAIMQTSHNRHRLRRDLFRVPIRWHPGDIDDVWHRQEKAFDVLIERAVGDFYENDGRTSKGFSISFNPWRFPGDIFYRLYPTMPYLRVMADALKGDLAALRKVCSGIVRRLGVRRSLPGKPS